MASDTGMPSITTVLGMGLFALTIAFCPTSVFAAKIGSVAYQLTPSHSGSIQLKRLQFPLKKQWTQSLGGQVSYPLVANNTVYVTAAATTPNGSELYALDLKTGKTLWKVAIAGDFNWSNATYDRGAVFVFNDEGVLMAFDAKSGAQLWSKNMPSSTFSPPTASGGSVFVGGGFGGWVVSVDEKTGAIQWESPVGGGTSSPAIGSGSVLPQSVG